MHPQCSLNRCRRDANGGMERRPICRLKINYLARVTATNDLGHDEKTAGFHTFLTGLVTRVESCEFTESSFGHRPAILSRRCLRHDYPMPFKVTPFKPTTRV